MRFILFSFLLAVCILKTAISTGGSSDHTVTPIFQSYYPPVGLTVDPFTLHAEWLPPGAAFNQLDEDWSSADFETNGWTFDPSPGNWQIDTAYGNTAPAARFKWTPGLTNYSHALVSRELNGVIMPNVILGYDLNLINYSTSTLEQLAVEVWDGSEWHEVALYKNSSGNIPWTTFTHDITELAGGQMFNVRFRAFGVNSVSIDWWSIDNIRVYADINGGDNLDLLGYYVYLDDAIVAFTPQTYFDFEPPGFNYGQTYTASVRAVYDAGLSAPASFAFVSEFLYRPCNLQGSDINHAVALTWQAPGTCEPPGTAVPTAGYNIYRNGSLIASPGSSTFAYTDQPLVAGNYTYAITALYTYGDTLVESQPAGPIHITVAPGAGFVVGTITDFITGDSLSGVQVSAGIYTTYSLNDGSYWLVAAEGVYDLVYNKPGYALHVIEDFEVLWLQTHIIDIELTPSEPNIPFIEDWVSEDFETNGWFFEPDQGNWIINNTEGNPAPSAEFNYSPPVSDYAFALISQEIDARGITEYLFLQFDMALSNYAPTGTEKLRVDIWDGTAWVALAEYSNTQQIQWNKQSFDISEIAGNRFTKIRFLAHGQNSFNIDNWRIDNIRIALSGSISVNPAQINTALHIGVIYNYPMTIFNSGLGELEYNIVPVYRREVESGNPVTPQGLELSTDPDHQPGGQPADPPALNTIILHYDGPNFDGIGLTAGGTFHVAARFPSSMVGQYAGYVMTSVDVYINNVPSNATLKIWGAGTGTSPGPILHQQVFTPAGSNWNNIVLNNGVTLVGTDIWVGYSVTHGAGQYPAGCDAGPANQNGDWISMDGLNWEHLAGYGLNYNWNIRARLIQGTPLWLSTDPVSGTIPANSTEHIDVIFNTTGLNGYSFYQADLYIYSNDPLTPLVIVPVALHTVNYLTEVSDSDWVVCYPIPAANRLHIDLRHPIYSFRILNQFGQVVIEQNLIEKATSIFDTSHLPNGLYFLQAEAKDGRTYSRKIVISR